MIDASVFMLMLAAIIIALTVVNACIACITVKCLTEFYKVRELTRR